MRSYCRRNNCPPPRRSRWAPRRPQLAQCRTCGSCCPARTSSNSFRLARSFLTRSSRGEQPTSILPFLNQTRHAVLRNKNAKKPLPPTLRTSFTIGYSQIWNYRISFKPINVLNPDSLNDSIFQRMFLLSPEVCLAKNPF